MTVRFEDANGRRRGRPEVASDTSRNDDFSMDARGKEVSATSRSSAIGGLQPDTSNTALALSYLAPAGPIQRHGGERDL